jgi:CRP-like cAMP-binding protein
MSDNDDLDALLALGKTGSTRGRNAKPGRRPANLDSLSNPAEPRGLNPLDLLSLPRAQRELVNWLARRKQARFGEIRQALTQDPEQVERTLSALQEAGYVHPVLLEGEIFYSVVFRGKVSRAGRGLGQDIWNLIDLDNVTFLEQTSLFHGLPRSEIQAIADRLEERHYTRNQVILWQGDSAEHLYLIKQGIVEITRLCPSGHAEKLDYMKPGDAMGEVSLLTGTSCTTTATAASQAHLLLIKRQDFDDLLAHYSSIAVELARILAQRLSSTTARLSRRAVETHLCVLIGVRPGAGCTTLGAAIALALTKMTPSQTVYTEYPAPDPLPVLLSPARDAPAGVYHHPGGYDVLIPRDEQGWPPNVRATLMLDQLRDGYANIVVGLSQGIGEKSAYLLEQADQVILVTPPDQASWEHAAELSAKLKATALGTTALGTTALRPDKSSLVTVVNRASQPGEAAGDQWAITQDRPNTGSPPPPAGAGFDIPFLATLPSPAEQRLDNLPGPLAQAARALADRLGRTHQIGVYVPTTLGVNQSADTQACLEKTLAFMGQLFGGATSNQAQGIWGREAAELVSETIYIVKSYVTQSDLDRHLPAVIEYVESLKHELKQEAMALEVNQKLMLI